MTADRVPQYFVDQYSTAASPVPLNLIACLQRSVNAINSHATQLDSVSGSLSVDMRTYGLVANSPGSAATNTAAVAQAISDFATTPAAFEFPTGTIYLDQVAASSWSIRLRGDVHTAPKAFLGRGRGITTMVQQGAGTGGQWSLFQIDSGFRGLTIAHMTVQQGTIGNPDPTDQMHLINVQNTTSATSTGFAEIYDVAFGQAIGSGFRVLGSLAGIVENVRVSGCTFDMSGIGPGARSCIEFQRGYTNIEISHCWARGAKNSVFDCEPTSDAGQFNFHVHDCVFDNRQGRTLGAVSLGGTGINVQQTRSRFHDNWVLEGILQWLSSDHCDMYNNTVYYQGGLNATIDGLKNGAVLLQVFQVSAELAIRNMRVINNYAGTTPGPLVQISAGENGAYAVGVTVDGGEYECANDGVMMLVQDVTRFRCINKPVFRYLGASPGTNTALNIVATLTSMDQVEVSGLTIQSPNGKLLQGVVVACNTNGLTVSRVSVCGVEAGNQVTHGVTIDSAGTGVNDKTPIIQCNDFDGATNAWRAIDTAAGVTFPIVAGNRGGVCTFAGTTAPGSISLSALQPSCYLYQNGNSSSVAYNLTGPSTWTVLTVP